MAVLAYKDATGAAVYLKVRGAGTQDDPFQPFSDPMTPVEIASSTIDEAGVAATPGLRLMGFSIRENASQSDVAEVVLRRGDGVNDPALAFISLGGDQSDTREFLPDGIECADGIYIERVSGETHIVLYTKVFE